MPSTGRPSVEDRRIALRRAGVRDALRSAGQDDADRVARADLLDRRVRRPDLGVDRQLAQTSGDQLGELRAEIENDDGLMGHGRNQKDNAIIAVWTVAEPQDVGWPGDLDGCLLVVSRADARSAQQERPIVDDRATTASAMSAPEHAPSSVLRVPFFASLFGKAQLGDVRPEHLLQVQVRFRDIRVGCGCGRVALARRRPAR